MQRCEEVYRVRCEARHKTREQEFVLAEVKIDVLKLGAVVLAHELIKPREKLQKTVTRILEREVTTVEMSSVKTKLVETNGIFIYGHAKENNRLVIKAAMQEILQTRQKFRIVTMRINGLQVADVCGYAYQHFLAAQLSRRNRPDLLVIVLENFTCKKFSKFQKCSFVTTQRANGIRIVPICSTTDYVEAKKICDDVNPKKMVFVPKKKGEKPWFPRDEENITRKYSKIATKPEVAVIPEEMPNPPEEPQVDQNTGSQVDRQTIDCLPPTQMFSATKQPVLKLETGEKSEIGKKEKSDLVSIAVKQPVVMVEDVESLDEISKEIEDTSLCGRISNCLIGACMCLIESIS